MSRRRRKAKAGPTILDWTEDFTRLFLYPADWTPPRTVKVWSGAKGITVTARFVTQTGGVSTGRVRLQPDAVAGGFTVKESSLTAHYVVGRR